jgi:tRNA(fMet)-specific endonuclease VapC
VGVVVDTSILVAAERGRIRFVELLESLGSEPVAMAAITAAELLHGCHRAGDAGVRVRRFAFVEDLLRNIPVLPFDVPEARRHAELWAELARRGKPIGPYDMLVAATALARGYGLLTLNRKEFARIRGLRLAPTGPWIA